MANFIWKYRIRASSWDSLCRPEDEGGIGIRRIQDLVAGLKLFWRCFTTAGVWASWMKKNYNTYTPSNATTHPMASGTWKLLLSYENLASLHIITGADFNTTDTWVWSAYSSGQFSFSSVLNISREFNPKFYLTNVVWCKANCPKMSCCLLRALTNRLLTKHRLKKFGFITEENCVLCNSSPKTSDLLFSSCEFLAYIWARCKLKLGLQATIQSLQEEACEFKEIYTKKTKLSALGLVTLCATVWHIWRERNNIIFDSTEHSKLEVFNGVHVDITVLVHFCHWKDEKNSRGLQILNNWDLFV